MLLHLHRPDPPLDRFVELITYCAGYQPDHTKERLLPDGRKRITAIDAPGAASMTIHSRRMPEIQAFRKRRWVGITPKQYVRIRRFQQVLTSVVGGSDSVDPTDPAAAELRSVPPPEPDWADIALVHGFYDQSHLVHDFREFSGLTPTAYISAFRGLENFLPID